MVTFLTVLHVFVCLFLILVVLLQAGKGGGMGIAFGGGGGSQTVFGSSGAGNFLTRLTSVTAAIFLITSLGLAHYSSQQDSKRLQQLAERKAGEKKSEDERAAKLKEDLDKARATIQKTAGEVAPGAAATTPPASGSAPAATTIELKPTTPGAPATSTTPVKPLKGAVPPAGKPSTAVGKSATAPAPSDVPASDGTTPAPKPAVRRKAKPKPVEEGTTDNKTAAPAEAPAAPAPPAQ
ncbi:MAG TPA: preprotein translocase subunit SecG [Polyangia bacterium]|jgi:preprotein translocase subunit SecG|nr:preprotein translocase subunit SecG [Polyangia bacterium]